MKYYAEEMFEDKSQVPEDQNDQNVQVYPARKKINNKNCPVIRYVCDAEDEEEAAKKINAVYPRGFTEKSIKQVIPITPEDIPENWRYMELSKDSNYKRVCYIGTHITGRSIAAGIPYKEIGEHGIQNMAGNCFWNALSAVYGITFSDNEKELLEQCKECNVRVIDLIGECECFGSKDSDILKGSEEKNPFFENVLRDHDYDLLVFNGKSTFEKTYRVLFKGCEGYTEGKNMVFFDLISTSNTAHWRKTEEGIKIYQDDGKEQEWSDQLGELVKR